MIKRVLIVAAGLCIAGNASASIVVDFESDTTGAKPNGFTSVDSSFIHFSDSVGTNLFVDNFGIASIGNGLAVGTDFDGSVLFMSFDGLVNSLSLDFGNDDPIFTVPGDVAILTAYLDGIEVGQSFVFMNGNTAMDQNILVEADFFNSATLEFYVSGDGATEIADNITFNVVPVPGMLALLAPALFLSRSRRRTA